MIGALKHAGQKIGPNTVELLHHPQRFELAMGECFYIVIVIAVLLVQPLIDRADDLVGVAGAEFHAGEVADVVFVSLEQSDHVGDRRPFDFGDFEQRFVLVADSPNPTVVFVAFGIAQIVLHVADQRVEPIDDIECSIGTELHIDRAEVGIAAGEQRFDRRSFEAAAFFGHPVVQRAEEADRVVDDVVALHRFRELAAADDRTGRRRPPLFDQELLHLAVFVRIDHIAAEGRREIVGPG